jgi:hypothetical protein
MSYIKNKVTILCIILKINNLSDNIPLELLYHHVFHFPIAPIEFKILMIIYEM